GPSYPAERTLAQVVAEGPRRAELVPERSGVAVLPNGGVRALEAPERVEVLARSWPPVVARAGARPVAYPGVAVRPLGPGVLAGGGGAGGLGARAVPGGSGATPVARFHGPRRVPSGRVAAGGRGRRRPSGAGPRPAGARAEGGDGAVAGPETCPFRLGAGMEA